MNVELREIGMVAAAMGVALIVALILTPVVKSFAQKVGAVDVPKDNRRMHDHPIPRMGGLAIFFGFILSALIFVPLSHFSFIDCSYLQVITLICNSIT